jgi:phosphatidylglycerol:prolipoprotein diacylglycerol transferase
VRTSPYLLLSLHLRYAPFVFVEAFEFGPFILWTHLLFLLLGVWLSSEFFFRLAQGASLSLQTFKVSSWWYVVSFIIGGRLFTILENYRLYIRDWTRIPVLWDGNFSFLGAAVGIATVLYLTTRQSRVTFLQWLDVLLPATTLGLAFDWLGKFAAGQGYGSPTDMAWGVTYNTPGVPYTVPVHPVQMYYAAFFLLLTFLLLIVRKHSQRAGSETLFGIVSAALGTMVFELFRGDPSTPVFATLIDLFVLAGLFGSLGLVAVFERRLSARVMVGYEVGVTVLIGVYFLLRPSLAFAPYQLRFSQFLAVLALLSVIVYVVVHRQRHPHL